MMDRCPNNCVDGWYVNPYTHKRIMCEYCAEKRKEEISDVNSDIFKELNLPFGYKNTRFSKDNIILGIDKMEESSVKDVLDAMESLIQGISVGELPSHSILFNLGYKVIESNFTVPLLVKGYLSGLATLPIIEVSALMRERELYERGDQSVFGDYIEKELCLVSIDAGTDYKGIMAVKGLMQLRARRRKPTIMITHVWGSKIGSLIAQDDYEGYDLAKLYSIQYISDTDKSHDSTPEKVSKNIINKTDFEKMKRGGKFGVE